MLKYITLVLLESVITIFSEGRIIFKKKYYFVARVRWCILKPTSRSELILHRNVIKHFCSNN